MLGNIAGSASDMVISPKLTLLAASTFKSPVAEGNKVISPMVASPACATTFKLLGLYFRLAVTLESKPATLLAMSLVTPVANSALPVKLTTLTAACGE